MVDLLIPFGKRISDGRMVEASEVPNGSHCGCICPQCDRGLVARQGDIYRHHFAHEADAECEGARESAVHLMAKQILLQGADICLPMISAASYQFHVVPPGAAPCVVFDSVGEEVRLPDMRPDIIGHSAALGLLVVEIAYRHRCEADKLALIRAGRMLAIEIDVSDLPDVISADALRQSVCVNAPRRWLYHAEVERCIQEEAEREAKARAEVDAAWVAHLAAKRAARAAYAAHERAAYAAYEAAEWQRADFARRQKWREDCEDLERQKEVQQRRITGRSQDPVYPAPQPGRYPRPAVSLDCDDWPLLGAYCMACGSQDFRAEEAGWFCVGCA